MKTHTLRDIGHSPETTGTAVEMLDMAGFSAILAVGYEEC
jgi:hypothetical protein